MRILTITNLYPPYVVGGAEKYVYEIVNELSKKDEVLVLTTTKPSIKNLIPKKDNNVVRFYPSNIYHTYDARKKPEIVKPLWHLLDFWNPHSYAITKKILADFEPDVVFTHNFGNLSTSIFSAIKDSEVRHVHMLHDHFLLCPRATMCKSNGHICPKPLLPCRIYRTIKRKFPSPDAVVAPSRFVIERHIENGFFRDSKFYHLPLPVKSVIRVGKSYEVFKILYVGSLTKEKGIQVLLEAVTGIDNVKLDVAGTGNLELPKYRKNVEFHGFLNDDRLAELYRKSNIVVVPSICFEVSPKVITEAFSYSTPVVASRIGGIPELVVDGKNGMLFEPGNLADLRDSLLLLKEDNCLLKKLERGAYNTAKGLVMDRHVRKLRKILKEA